MPSTLLEPALEQPFTTWKTDSNRQNTGTLLRALDPLINTALRTYGGPTAQSPAFKAQAKRLALEAMQTYDPSRASVKTHLMSRMQRLRRIAAQQRQIVRLPEQVAMDQMHVDTAARELEDTLGRPPSDAELADYSGLSVKRLAYIRGGKRPVARGSLPLTGENEAQMDPGIVQPDAGVDEWSELVYDDQDDINKYIMERTLGMHGRRPTTPSAIAAALKLSPAAISHRMQRIQQQLDKRETLDML